MLPEGETYTVCWLRLGEDEYPLLEYLTGLLNTDKAGFAAVIDKMRRLEHSGYHREPAVKSLQGKRLKGVYELRVMTGIKRMYARIPFVKGSGNVILMFGDTKKGGAPPPGFINKAISLKEKLIKQEAQYEKIDFTIFDE